MILENNYYIEKYINFPLKNDKFQQNLAQPTRKSITITNKTILNT